MQSPYTTPLNLRDQLGFEVFKKGNNIPDDSDRFDSTYDLSGFYKNEVSSRSLLDRLLGDIGEDMPDGVHYTDKYKTPFHPTYSNESRYKYPGLNRSWVPNGDDGTWSLKDNNTGEVIRDERNAFAFPGLLRG